MITLLSSHALPMAPPSFPLKDSLAVSLEGILAPARKMGRGPVVEGAAFGVQKLHMHAGPLHIRGVLSSFPSSDIRVSPALASERADGVVVSYRMRAFITVTAGWSTNTNHHSSLTAAAIPTSIRPTSTTTIHYHHPWAPPAWRPLPLHALGLPIFLAGARIPSTVDVDIDSKAVPPAGWRTIVEAVAAMVTI